MDAEKFKQVYICLIKDFEFTGKTQFIRVNYDDDEYRSKVYNNPTRTDMLEEANKSITKLNDHHNVFLEDLYVKKENGINIVQMYFGN